MTPTGLTEQQWEDCKRYLTEKVLGECWHKWEWIPGGGMKCKCCTINLYKKDDVRYEQVIPVPQNPTFTTITDLLALYEVMGKVGKWVEFKQFASHRPDNFGVDFDSWLFCLNAPDQIPERCMMVAEFAGWKG